jgi:hypothetical protein
MSGAGTSVPIGVYRGAAADLAPVQAYEAFLGMPAGTTVSYVLAFMADSPATWAQFEQAIMPDVTNGPPGSVSAAAWAPLLGDRQLVLSVPACAMGTTWTTEGAGVNDAHWSALAGNLAAAGLGGCLLRIAREFNGSWYRWQVTTGNAAAYKTGYARIVAVMRDAGFTGQFVWNPYLGQGTFGPSSGAEDAYPGDSSVDLIGLDVYDGNWTGVYPAAADEVTTAGQSQVWDGMTGEWDSLRGWHDLALAHGKQLCFPEWGLRLWEDAGIYHGGGDNALLVHRMADFSAGCSAAFHAFWEDVNMGVADPDDNPGRTIRVPQARGAFLSEFGY